MLILKRVAGEGFDFADCEHDLAQQVEATVERGIQVTRDLASDSRLDAGGLEGLQGGLDDLRRAVLTDGQSDDVLHEHAALFALEEIEDALRRLVQVHDPGRGDTESATASGAGAHKAPAGSELGHLSQTLTNNPG